MSSPGCCRYNLSTRLIEQSSWPIDHYVYDIFLTVTFGGLGTTICFLGTIANAVNIVVFLKQGFQESINISLFALAVSDGLCLLAQLWVSIGQTPLLAKIDTEFVAAEISNVTGSIPYLCFSRISAMIMTYINVERCLCVVTPLKVRIILNQKKSVFVVVFIFILMIVITAPAFFVNRLQWDYYPDKNRTMIRNSFAGNRAEVESIVYALNNFLGYTSFVCTIAFTVVLVTVLKTKAKWRNKTVSDLPAVGRRDRKVVLMVVVVSTVSIACSFPKTLIYFMIMIEPKFDHNHPYHKFILMAISLAFCLEVTDCSINIFIYRTMSSKYRKALKTVISCRLHQPDPKLAR